MILLNIRDIILNDVPTPWNMYFQDSASPIAEGIQELHDSIVFYMIIVICLVTYILLTIIRIFKRNKFTYKYLLHGTTLEVIWTLFPAVVLILIAFPSFILLYLSDDVINPSMTVKAIGYHWYWVYEYSDFIHENGENIQLESYIIPDDLLKIIFLPRFTFIVKIFLFIILYNIIHINLIQ